MSSSSNDISLNAHLFNPSSISPETHAFNQKAMDLGAQSPKWFEVGAPAYRRMRIEGKTAIPPATYLESARTIPLPSRDANRTIPCRLLKPTNGRSVKGVFLHIHGGGWVLQHEDTQDPYLQLLANETGTLIISAGYRLAPEHPYPAGPADCFDVAEYLVRNAHSEFGAPLSFVGGESAGAHLSMLVALHLLQHPDPTFSGFSFKGLVLHFGAYDLSFLPQVFTFKKPAPLVLDYEIMRHFVDAFLPGAAPARLKEPDVSPLYTDFERLRGRLPPALYTCGTEDPLLDDSVFMSAKWMMAGAEAVVKIVPGGAHGYIYFITEPASGSQHGLKATTEFMTSRLG